MTKNEQTKTCYNSHTHCQLIQEAGLQTRSVALDGWNCFTITDRKQLEFANRYGIDFVICCVKSDLKDKLKITNGIYPIVNIESVRFEN